jgi:hypothetical protein
MVSEGRHLLEGVLNIMLANAAFLQVYGSDSLGPSWGSALICESSESIQSALDLLATQGEGIESYPIIVWSLPNACLYEAQNALNSFLDDISDRELWKRVLDSGITRLTVNMTTASISTNCTSFDALIDALRVLLKDFPMPVVWHL